MATLDDSRLTSSSMYSTAYSAAASRINGVDAWVVPTADLNVNQWIQADLGDVKVMVKVATQGRSDWSNPQFVTSYTLSTSYGGEFMEIVGESGDVRLFSGNVDHTGVVTHCIEPTQAQHVKLQPLTWFNHISLRWEIYVLVEAGMRKLLTISFSAFIFASEQARLATPSPGLRILNYVPERGRGGICIHCFDRTSMEDMQTLSPSNKMFSYCPF